MISRAYLPTYLPTYLFLALVGLCGGAAAQQHAMEACHSGELWSQRYPNLLPGDFVHIPANLTVVLDTQTVDLGGLWVQGDLVFDHTKPGNTVELRTAYAVVTGTLQIGCKQGTTITRFTKKTHVTLIAPELYYDLTLHPMIAGVNWPTTMATRFGTSGPIYEAALDRGLIVAGTGELYVFGNDSRAQTWTTLAATVAQDDILLPLSDPVWDTWRVGDEIVIASTDFEYADQWANGLQGGVISTAKMGGHAPGYVQGEERALSALNPGTQSVSLSAPLDHGHWAAAVTATFPSGPETVDMRAEVGNLTRSVVIRGEPSAYSSLQRGGTTHRGHVILLKEAAEVPYCEVDWAEFENLGVQGKLGRYPFHWHMLGDARNGSDRPYLRDCSIHHCVNRFVTIHNTTHVDVERNVGWDTQGAGYFLEDATEAGVPEGDQTQFVLLRDNLGMKVGRTEAHVSDYPTIYQELEKVDPPVFWIQHPNQIIEGNHAAGAAGHGFYLLPGSRADGWTHLADGSSSFKDNVAHSNGQNGFFQNARVEWGYDPNATNPAHAPTAEGLVAWKNRRYGIWWRTHGVALLRDCQAADNKSGYYPASGGRQDAHDGQDPPTCRLTWEGGVIFGETPNVGEIVNDAETDAWRALPQTYWNFIRPDAFSSPHESAWDTLNAFESYDGRNVVTGLKVAYFPGNRSLRNPHPSAGGSAEQKVGAVTQVEYNSRYCEDPRNDVAAMEYGQGAGQSVANPILYRPTSAGLGHSMLRNTVVYDHDGTLGHGADVYVCYDDEFFEANATGSGTQVLGPNLRVLPTALADFAQFELNTDLPEAGAPQMTVSVSHHAGGTRSLILSGMPSDADTADYGFNAPIGLDNYPAIADGGVYRCNFGGQMPTAYEIKIQFAEAEGVPTIIGVPLTTTLNSLYLNTYTDLKASQPKANLTELLNAPEDNAWFHDTSNGILYIKTTTVVLGTNGPDLDGTRNVIEVN